MQLNVWWEVKELPENLGTVHEDSITEDANVEMVHIKLLLNSNCTTFV